MVVEVDMLAWFRCFVRQHHRPSRHPLGGFKCLDCGVAGSDLDEMGFEGDGYVSPIRRLFSREFQEYTRTASWETGPLPVLSAYRGTPSARR